MDRVYLTEQLKAEAVRLGFDLAAATRAVVPPGLERFHDWLDAGYAGQMSYLDDRRAAYHHPSNVSEAAQSLLVLAVNYCSVDPSPTTPGTGMVSRYAWGAEYHDLIRRRLNRLADFHRQIVPDARVRGVIDTAPLLERDFAQLAGLGWIGKNTMLINRRLGSWFFLATLLTSEELEFDQPDAADHCGTCRACLDACPTGALVDAHTLDARRCLSYLTIETSGDFPSEFRQPVGDRLFGCDACQQVCPWNRRAPATSNEAFGPLPDMNPMELAGLFALDDQAFRARFRHTPFWRAKRPGILRNAAVVLGNRPSSETIPALTQGINDTQATVRAASAWALGQHTDPLATDALEKRLAIESNAGVREEIESALDDGCHSEA